MMRLCYAFVRRDLMLGWSSGGIALPLIFLLLVASLYPFAVGPDARTLAASGAGMVWMAALLAALLPIDRLIAPDRDAGVMDQLLLRGWSDEAIAGLRMASHWIGFGPPLMLAALPAAALLGVDAQRLWRLELGLLLGTPGLAALGVLAAALTAGVRGSGALTGLLALPLAIPVLIFGAGALEPGSGAALKFLGAVSLLLLVLSPVAAGAALRAGRE